MGAIGTGAGVGAGTGAILGSIVPGVGTLAGTLVGGYLGAGGGLLAKMMTPKQQGATSVQMPASPEIPKLEDASAKAQAQADERRRAMARSKSVQTNPLGISDEATVARKKLLGG